MHHEQLASLIFHNLFTSSSSMKRFIKLYEYICIKFLECEWTCEMVKENNEKEGGLTSMV